MPGITNNKLVKVNYDTSQKGTVSTITEEYILQINTFVDIVAVSNMQYTASGTDDADKPILRQRYINDKRYVCTNIRYDYVGVLVYKMTVTYTTYLNVGEIDQDDPILNNTLWCKIQRRTAFRMVNIWRYTASLPVVAGVTGVAPWPPTAVVVGTPVDIFGQPEANPVVQQTVQVEVVLDRSQQKLSNGSANYWPTIWSNNVFKRNSVSFLSYPAGSLVFKGFSETLTEDPWATYTLDFLFDALCHLEQRVLPNVTGGPLLTQSSTWAGKVIRQADAAYWYQPYYRYGLCDINADLSPTGAFNELIQPTPVQI